jgi:uncharacterized linocin/CFP29 family protein
VSDFFMRENAPLSAEEWERLDKVVVQTARQFLVGRRFVELAGPFGAGTEVIPVGVGEDRKYLDMQVIQEDFSLFWRDVEASRKMGVPLELGPAAMASAKCAHQEDQMIFDGLWDAAQDSVALGDWDEPGQSLQDIVAATEKLVEKDFYGPFAVVLNPALYAKTQRVARGMGRLVGKLIADVAEGGMFRSPLLEADRGLVVSLGVHNFDLAVAQDLVTAYTGNEKLDHHFRVLESLVLRVKRPGAICKLKK